MYVLLPSFVHPVQVAASCKQQAASSTDRRSWDMDMVHDGRGGDFIFVYDCGCD